MTSLRPSARRLIPPPRQEARRAAYYAAAAEFDTTALDARLQIWRRKRKAWLRERRNRRLIRVVGFVLGVVLVFMAGISVGARRAASANLVDPQLHYAQRITRLVPGTLACEQDVHEGCLICYHRFAAGPWLISSHC